MRRVDTFVFNDELDMLECRLSYLDTTMDLFVLVEADVTYADATPKRLHYLEHQDRFAPWADRIIHVTATGLPDGPDPWQREFAQREFVWEGLEQIGVDRDDIIFHSDVDEIPNSFQAGLINPRGFVAFEQTMHPFAVDWLHPNPLPPLKNWRGTVAGRAKQVDKILGMRDARLTAPTVLPNSGWHFSWVGSPELHASKMRSFSHPEIRGQWESQTERCWAEGIHVDGAKLIPIDIDDTFPRWIHDYAPKTWFRPR